MKEIEEQVLVVSEETVPVDDVNSQNQASESETNKGITEDIEVEMKGTAGAGTSGTNHNDTEHDHEYDVFISYNSHDRPWVRDVLLPNLERLGKKVCVDYRDFSAGAAIADNISHAIQSSRVTIIVLSPSYLESQWCHYEIKQALATSQGRVLPLILVECELPAILKHVTYLDATCDDVQPYFIERLNESLERADNWTVYSDILNNETLESKVQNVLTKNKKAKKAEAKARKNRKNLRLCLCTPCTLIFIVYLFFVVFGVIIYAAYINNPIQHFHVKFQSPNQAVSILAPEVGLCEALSIKPLTTFHKQKFDIFLFARRREEFFKRVVENVVLNFSLHSKSYRSLEYTMINGRTLECKFCFNSSRSTQDLRIYKLFDSDMANFNSSWLSENWRYKDSFEKYRVSPGILKCGSLTINGTSSGAKQLDVVFANPGKSTASVVVRNQFHKFSLNKKGSFKKCNNATSCSLPMRQTNYYAFIVRNTTDPFLLWNSKEYEVHCVARKTTIANFTLIIAASFALYIVSIKCCIVGGCYKRVKRCYGSKISDEEVRRRFMEL